MGTLWATVESLVYSVFTFGIVKDEYKKAGKIKQSHYSSGQVLRVLGG
jgi:hypothetical protein